MHQRKFRQIFLGVAAIAVGYLSWDQVQAYHLREQFRESLARVANANFLDVDRVIQDDKGILLKLKSDRALAADLSQQWSEYLGSVFVSSNNVPIKIAISQTGSSSGWSESSPVLIALYLLLSAVLLKAGFTWARNGIRARMHKWDKALDRLKVLSRVNQHETKIMELLLEERRRNEKLKHELTGLSELWTSNLERGPRVTSTPKVTTPSTPRQFSNSRSKSDLQDFV